VRGGGLLPLRRSEGASSTWASLTFLYLQSCESVSLMVSCEFTPSSTFHTISSTGPRRIARSTMASLWFLCALPLLAHAAASKADHAVTWPPANWPEASSSYEWWPAPPFTTESGPISPHRSKPPVTISMTGIPSSTYSSPPEYSSAWGSTLSSSSANATSSGPPSPTGPAGGNGTLPACKPIQYDFPAGSGSNDERAEAVKAMYLEAWNAYSAHAFGKDELLPLNASSINNWYGWGVTIVDGIDTAIIMNLTDVVAQQLAFIAGVDFTRTAYGPVEIFDVNIRYVGGLLSAYDLLKSGQFPNDYDQGHVEALLSQAVTLADKIAFGFDSPTGLAASNVNFTSDTPVFGTYTIAATNTTYNATNTASTGTFILEWARLSDLTGNATYRRLAERAESYLVNPSPAPVFPGLVGTEFDVDTGEMLTFDGGWHSGVDSMLEYLLKIYQYQVTPTTTQYKDFWLTAVQSTVEYIAVHPYHFPDLTFISELDVNGSLQYAEDSFTCFAGGNFLLGARLLDLPQLLDLGVAVTDGCHWTYNTTVTGLEPIGWAWYNESDLAYDPLDDNDAAARKLAAKYGYWIPQDDENWEFRPEEIESIFYAYRITGDARWAEYNWEIFQAINETARNDVAFATVDNVNMPFGGTMSNNLDSYVFTPPPLFSRFEMLVWLADVRMPKTGSSSPRCSSTSTSPSPTRASST